MQIEIEINKFGKVIQAHIYGLENDYSVHHYQDGSGELYRLDRGEATIVNSSQAQDVCDEVLRSNMGAASKNTITKLLRKSFAVV